MLINNDTERLIRQPLNLWFVLVLQIKKMMYVVDQIKTNNFFTMVTLKQTDNHDAITLNATVPHADNKVSSIYILIIIYRIIMSGRKKNDQIFVPATKILDMNINSAFMV